LGCTLVDNCIVLNTAVFQVGKCRTGIECFSSQSEDMCFVTKIDLAMTTYHQFRNLGMALFSFNNLLITEREPRTSYVSN